MNFNKPSTSKRKTVCGHLYSQLFNTLYNPLLSASSLTAYPAFQPPTKTDMDSLTSQPAPFELPVRPKDFRKRFLQKEDIDNIRFVSGHLSKCSLTSCISGDYAVLDECTVEKCIISYASIRNNSIIRNTIIIDAYITNSELHNCTIIQSSVDSCKVVNCSIRKEDDSDSDFNIPTEQDLSEWDMDLDIFPPEDLYQSDSEIYDQPLNREPGYEQERDQRDLKFSNCEIIGSQMRDSTIQSTKIYGGHINDCNFHTSVLTQLAAQNCSINYSEIQGSRLEQSTSVHTLLKACIEDGLVIKHRASGSSLSVLPVEIRLRVFEYVIGGCHGYAVGWERRYGANLERSIPALVKALRVQRTQLYQEALEVFAKNYYFRLCFPVGLEDTRIPSQSLQRLSICGVKTMPTTQVGDIQVGHIRDIRYYSLSPLDENKLPHFNQLMDLHMSIEVYSKEQVVADFRVMIGFAKKHALERLSITHEERLEHHRLYSPEPPHKAEHRGYINEVISEITSELEVSPLLTRMTAYEINGHDLPGEPNIYIPKHNWGGSQYTWTWIAEESNTLEWETEN